MESNLPDVDTLWTADAWTWRWNLQTDEMEVGDRALEVLGFPPGTAAGDPGRLPYARMHAEDREAMREDILLRAALDSAVFEHSLRLLHHDGSWLWVRSRGRVATRTPDGHPEWVMGLAFDQTEQRALEEQSRATSVYERSLLEASVDPLMTIGVDGRIMDVNAATEVATGRARQDLIGSDFADCFSDPDEARAGYQQAFTFGRVVDHPLTLQHGSGRGIEVLFNASTFHAADGRVAGVFAAAHDVTETRRIQRDLEANNREMVLLSEMSDLLQSCQSVTEAAPVIKASMLQLFPQSRGRMFVHSGVSSRLEEAVSWGGLDAAEVPINPASCWALHRNSLHDVNLGSHLNPPCHFLRDEHLPYVCIPLLAQGQALGIMHVVAEQAPPSRDRFTHLARATGDSISLALANIRLRENLQELSTRDPLTGLYNRRFLEDALVRELSRAGRTDRMGVVAMMDIDHFKMYNDTYGHDAGDAVLVAFAAQLKGFRGSDLPCRYGGEEFLLVLTDLTMEQAQVRMEKFRLEIAGLKPLHHGKSMPGITVSIGLAPFPQKGEDAAALIRHADAALYRAKEGGRNRIEVADGLLST